MTGRHETANLAVSLGTAPQDCLWMPGQIAEHRPETDEVDVLINKGVLILESRLFN
jgi:hypothetical protein